MRGWRRLGWLICLWPALAAAAADPALYTVRRIDSVIADDQRIGRRQAGLACLPAGLLRWKDVPTGTIEQQREIVRDVMEAAGLRVTTLAPSEIRRRSRAVVLTGTIDSAALIVCARTPGLLSGEAALEIAWRIERGDGASPAERYVSLIRRQIDRGAGRPIGVLYSLLLQDAAADLARHLAAPGPEAPR